MAPDETERLEEEKRQAQDSAAGWERLYHDLVARIHNTLRGPESAGERLATPPGHYYSPIPALADLLAHADRIWPSPPPRTLPAIDLNEQHQLEVLSEVAAYYSEQPWSDEKQEGLRYYFQNPMYSYADALYLYGMLRKLRPQRLIEVGSGYTSSVTLDTNDRFLGGQVHCTFVDPEPQRLLSLLSEGDHQRATIISQQVQEVPLSAFEPLSTNDILFIDSSHVSKAGSDVNYLFLEVLPRLASGVYVHIHDVFYPLEYPRDWLEDGRHYNEDYLLRAFLMYNDAFSVELFGSYLYTFHADEMRRLMPLTLHNPGGSLWLRKH
jgi:Methyltransferase domain